jgi:hypothetical protein
MVRDLSMNVAIDMTVASCSIVFDKSRCTRFVDFTMYVLSTLEMILLESYLKEFQERFKLCT